MTEHRDVHGVEPICQVLQVAPSMYYRHAQREADANLRPKRWWKDQMLRPQIRRVWEENRRVYGVRKVWRQLKREGYQVACYTVERLMGELALLSGGGSHQPRTLNPTATQGGGTSDELAGRDNESWAH